MLRRVPRFARDRRVRAQATVTPSLVMWVVPYRDFGGGSYRPAANYAFDRASGVLKSSGSDFVGVAYCQRGARLPPCSDHWETPVE